VPLDDAFARGREPSAPGRTAEEWSEVRDSLRQAVSRLHPTAAEMFVLRYFEGYDNAEVARIMDTSEGSVAVTLHRTRARLQKELAPVL
jgi:RNA polymerase sigma-70 factor (ECF subfamily)